MSAVATAWAKTVIKNSPLLGPSEKRLLKAIARRHSAKLGCAQASFCDLSEETSDSRRTVIRATSRLQSYGLLDKETQRIVERQGANKYYLNMQVMRVSSRPYAMLSECQIQTSELVSPCHPEKYGQSDTVTPPIRAHARALLDHNRGPKNQAKKLEGSYLETARPAGALQDQAKTEINLLAWVSDGRPC